MTIFSESCEAAGIPVHLTADSEDLLAVGAANLRRHPTANKTGESWQLDVRRGEFSSRNDALHLLWEGALGPDCMASNWAGPASRRWELKDTGEIDVDLAQRRATITLRPNAASETVEYFVTSFVSVPLAEAGVAPVHAACLAAPAGNAWRSVLVVALSNTGKTTTSLALADQGWKLMGDDVAYLDGRAGDWRAWGYPRQCHIRPYTLKLLPWLAELPLVRREGVEELGLPLAMLGDRIWKTRSGTHETALPLGLIVVLEPHNREGHRLTRLDRATALIGLSHENVRPIEGAADLTASQLFRLFAQVVQQTPVVGLSVGPSCKGLLDMLAEHVQ